MCDLHAYYNTLVGWLKATLKPALEKKKIYLSTFSPIMRIILDEDICVQTINS